MNRTQVRSVVASVIDGIRSEQVTFIAASLAYYAFISLLPLLLLTIVIGTTMGGVAFQNAVAQPVTRAVGGEAGELIREAISQRSGSGGVTVISLLVLVWSGLKLFRGLDIAFSTIYGVESSRGFLGQLQNAIVSLLAVAVGITLTVAIGAVIAVANVQFIVAGVDIVGTIGTIVQLGGLALTLLPLYYILPDPTIPVREAVPGAAFTAVGWTLLQTVFRIYTAQATDYAAYGAIGAVLLLVTFLYFGGLILLVGVVVNATLAGRFDGEPKTETTT